jgi:hypothetical protein
MPIASAVHLPGLWRHMTEKQKLTLVNDVSAYTLEMYHDPAIDVTDVLIPPDGFCLPIDPDYRTTNSPTGGVVGRYLYKPRPHAYNYGGGSSESSNSSPLSPFSFSTLGARDGNVPAYHNQQSRSEGQYGRPPLSDEDRNFLISKLRGMVAPKMPDLVHVHSGRPGANIVRMDRFTKELYACIPCIPYAPKDGERKAEYNLRTYDEYQQGSMGHERRKLFPVAPGSSLATCSHCSNPKSILQNETLCPYHAYYLVTGKYLGYYELCALVEMEKRGMSVSYGWWTVEELAAFVPFLTDKLRRWSLLASSEEFDFRSTWPTKASPFGAVKEPVPRSSRNKSGRQLGVELQLLQRFDSLDETKMGPRLTQVYRQAIGPSAWVRCVAPKVESYNQPGMVNWRDIAGATTPATPLRR